MLAKILIKGRGHFSRIDGLGTNGIGEGSHYPIYGGKQFTILRDGCEVLKRKKKSDLKENQVLQVALYTH